MRRIPVSMMGVLLAFVVVPAQAQAPRGPTFNGRVTVQTDFQGGGGTLDVYNRNADGDVAIGFLSGPGGDFKGNIAFIRSVEPPERFVILQGAPPGLPLTLIEDGTGNVGVGTPDPTAPLHARGNQEGGPIINVDNVNVNGDVPIDFRLNGELVGNVGVVRETMLTEPRRFFVLQNNPGSLHLTLSEEGFGNVGVALKNPLFRFDVNGDVNTSTCYRVAGGQALGTCYSDRRLKQNIRPLSNSLEKISALQPVRFEWRTEEFPDHRFRSGKETGLVGQDVEEVFPHLVTTDASGFKRVTYGLELQMQMIQAIKELKAQNDELRTRVRHLETRLSEGH